MYEKHLFLVKSYFKSSENHKILPEALKLLKNFLVKL